MDKHHLHAERQSRLFEKGDLKYLILSLLKDKPGHGYEIMRAMEDSSHGCYTPSAGSVYPTLQMLEDMGYVKSSEKESKKIYTITPEGLQFLKEKKQVIEKIKCQMEDWCEPYSREEFHESIHLLRDTGEMIRQYGNELTDAQWDILQQTIKRLAEEVEEIVKAKKNNDG